MKQDRIPVGIIFIAIIFFIPAILFGAYLVKNQISPFLVHSTTFMILLFAVLGFGLLKLIPIVRKVVIVLSGLYGMGLIFNFFIFYDKVKSKLSFLEYFQINYSQLLVILFLIWVMVYLSLPAVKRIFVYTHKE